METPLSILVVEDNPDLAANLVDYLSGQGHLVDAASDGLAGLRLASGHDFDVILLDLIPPGIDGISLCRRLRNEADKATPILMLTARDTLDDKIIGLDAGADDYLVKPFAMREVAAAADPRGTGARGLARRTTRFRRRAPGARVVRRTEQRTESRHHRRAAIHAVLTQASRRLHAAPG